PSEQLRRNEIEAALAVRTDVFNAQQQPGFSWPAVPAVARAYLDQLSRENAIDAGRAEAVRKAVAARRPAADDLGKLAAQLEQDAAGANAHNAARLRGLADTLKRMASSGGD